jgi:exodeoxyribonuclease VII large subunit
VILCKFDFGSTQELFMPEKVSDRTIFSLSEVTKSIQKTISERYTVSFWVKAEMNRLNHYPQSGHCYPELVEKADGKIVAEMRSTIWKDDFQRINDNFLKVLHEPLKNGINILFCAKISYSPVYGLSLLILDVDPSYTLGELEREKRETIDRIRKEGVFDANRSLKLALLPKRIAIISVQTSKGYSDFLQVLDNNGWGYSFFHMLFPSVLQGEHAVESIIGQLLCIKKVQHHFDAVAIIRGGGGDVGLSCYNSYALAKEIALFPIPVLTGIGHSTNETVIEMIAFKNAITPTELADYLIQKFHNFSVPLQMARDSIVERIRARIRDEKQWLLNTVGFLKKDVVYLVSHTALIVSQAAGALGKGTGHILSAGKDRLIAANSDLAGYAVKFIIRENVSLAAIEKNIDLLDPANVLKRGYSITMAGGTVLKSIAGLQEGTILKTTIADGDITSVIKATHKTDQP